MAKHWDHPLQVAGRSPAHASGLIMASGVFRTANKDLVLKGQFETITATVNIMSSWLSGLNSRRPSLSTPGRHAGSVDCSSPFSKSCSNVTPSRNDVAMLTSCATILSYRPGANLELEWVALEEAWELPQQHGSDNSWPNCVVDCLVTLWQGVVVFVGQWVAILKPSRS